MGFARTVIGLIALTSGFFYLTSASSLTDNGKWTLIGVTFAFTTIWVLMGGRGRTLLPVQEVSTQVTSTEEIVEQEVEEDSDIPQPVTQDSLDGASLRERKLAKIKAAELEQQSLNSEDDGMLTLEEVEVEIEELHTADEYVVEVSPESVEDADIEVTVSNRRIKHQEIRNRIENVLSSGPRFPGTGPNPAQNCAQIPRSNIFCQIRDKNDPEFCNSWHRSIQRTSGNIQKPKP
mgnify:CR=1 FL=1